VVPFAHREVGIAGKIPGAFDIDQDSGACRKSYIKIAADIEEGTHRRGIDSRSEPRLEAQGFAIVGSAFRVVKLVVPIEGNVAAIRRRIVGRREVIMVRGRVVEGRGACVLV
jgi:hypothetical protein